MSHLSAHLTVHLWTQQHLSNLPLCVFRKHEKLHSAERPFACEICSKAFTTHAHLKGKLAPPTLALGGVLTDRSRAGGSGLTNIWVKAGPPPVPPSPEHQGPHLCSRTPEDPHGLQTLQV